MTRKQKGTNSNASARFPAAPPPIQTEPSRGSTRGSPEVTHEEIAARAYELFLARGGEAGHHQEDWYQAERELRLGKH